MNNPIQSSIAPVEYLKIFFRRKWLLTIPIFAGLILGICASILLPRKYVSSTIILVEEGKTDNPLFDKLTVSTTLEQRMSTIRESMLGWNSLVELVKRLKLDKDVKTPYEFERLVDDIRRAIRISPRGKNIIDLSYKSGDPQETQAVVKNITDIFIGRNVNIQNQETSDAIKFIEEQLKVYKGKIKSAEIVALQDQLNNLLVDSTEQHPMVKELKGQIANKKTELAKENLQYTETGTLKYETANPLINEIKKTLDSIQTKTQSATVSAPAAQNVGDDIYKVMLMDKLDNVMARDVRVNEDIYNVLLQRLETAKITQRLQSSKEGTKYTILDPPRVPLKPVQPNVIMVMIAGLVSGAMVGAAFVVMSEFLDNSFLDVQEAKEFLGEPLLGAISTIRTTDSVKEEQEKQKWYLSLTVTAGVVAIALAISLASFIR